MMEINYANLRIVVRRLTPYRMAPYERKSCLSSAGTDYKEEWHGYDSMVGRILGVHRVRVWHGVAAAAAVPN